MYRETPAMPPTPKMPLTENLSFNQYCWVSDHLMQSQDRMVGQTMQCIEMLGLTDKQEDAIKQTIKQLIWDEGKNSFAYLQSLTDDYKTYEKGNAEMWWGMCKECIGVLKSGVNAPSTNCQCHR